MKSLSQYVNESFSDIAITEMKWKGRRQSTNVEDRRGRITKAEYDDKLPNRKSKKIDYNKDVSQFAEDVNEIDKQIDYQESRIKSAQSLLDIAKGVKAQKKAMSALIQEQNRLAELKAIKKYSK